MNKTITLFFLILVSVNNITAQCTTGYNGSNTIFTEAVRTGQTFQVTCTGLLSTIVFNPTNPNIDDLRGQNVFVGVRLRDNAGAIIATATINGASNTDQWFNGATVTADFTTANLTLTANTTYRWEVFETTNNIPLYLFGRNNSNPYALGNYFQDNTSISGADAEDWTVNVQANLSSELFEQEKISVYPNPSNGIFNIENEGSTIIEIFDILGNQITTQKANVGTTMVDLNGFTAGIYFAKITTENNQTQTVKLIKQ
mgnify:FL=1